MTETQFAIGDIVKLKSGGPTMTISQMKPDGSIGCIWFPGNEKKEYDEFPGETLKKVNPAIAGSF